MNLNSNSVGLGVLQEISGRRRDRMFSYARFLALLGGGME